MNHSHRGHMSRTMVIRTLKSARVSAGVAMAITIALFLPTTAAHAASYTEEVVQSGPLRVTSVVSSTMSSLEPQFESGWQVGVQTTQPLDGELHVGIDLLSDPALAQGMTLEVWACPERWVNRACAPGYNTWLAPTQLVDGIQIDHDISQTREINAWNGTTPVWLIFRITTDNTLRSDAEAQFLVAVWGEGVLVSLGPTTLAHTGHDFGWQLGIAVLAIGLSIPLILVPAMRRRADRNRDNLSTPAIG